MESAAGGGLNNQGMRLGRIGAGLALLMLGSVAVGCGDGQPAPQAQGEVIGPVTKPRVAAFAQEVRLRASDLPKSTTLPTESDNAGDEIGAQFASCTGSGLNPPTVAEFVSPTSLYAEDEESAAFVTQLRAAPTPYEAEALIALRRSPEGLACFQQLLPGLVAGFASAGSEVRVVSVSRLTVPLPPTRYSFAIRVEMNVIEGVHRTHSFADQIGFVSGPTEIVLNAIGTPTPVNQTVEAGLTALLYSRALRTGF